jgi:hypothetical protein
VADTEFILQLFFLEDADTRLVCVFEFLDQGLPCLAGLLRAGIINQVEEAGLLRLATGTGLASHCCGLLIEELDHI